MIRPKIAETVPEEDWKIFVKVQAIIEGLPDELQMTAYFSGVRLPRDVAVRHLIPNCHVFTWALAKFLPVDVHDGHIHELRAGGEEKRHHHSWLTRQGGDGKVIIDPWPLGTVSGPALFIQDYCFHFGNECSYLEHRSEDFLRQVAALRLEIRKVIKRRNIPWKAAA